MPPARAVCGARLAALTLAVALLSGVVPASDAQDVSLPIPPLAKATREGTRVQFRLTPAAGSAEFRPGVTTATLGYNGDYLGPTIRVRRGDSVSIAVQNNLDEATTVHWHGLYVPARSDGGPHQLIEPGMQWTADFTVRQAAATLWYHPHPMGRTGIQVYEGLAGLMIIDDEISDALDLPRDYGVNDIPLVVQDRTFDSQGRFVYVRGMPDVMHGIVGEELLVNGAIDPVFQAPRGLVRLRILNGSDSNVFRFRLLDDGEPVEFDQIATDGGFLPAPHRTDAVILATGERAEIVVDLGDYRRGSELTLHAESFQGPEYRALRLRVGGVTSREPRVGIPQSLVPPPSRDVQAGSYEREFVMSTMGPAGSLTINGSAMDMDRIDFEMPRNTTEVWRITNPARGMMAFPHTFHIHNGQFLVVDINGEPPPHELSGWKDTFLVWPNDVLRVRVRFEEYTGLYMYHCHFLVHEDAGMMGQFAVTE